MDVVRLTRREPFSVATLMKTTADIADDLLLRAKREAEASQTTLRSHIEEGCVRCSAARRCQSKSRSSP